MMFFGRWHMKFLRRGLGILVALMAFSGALAAQDGFYLKDGDRVVFYGDSITDQRLYTVYAETYTLTRFPQLNVSFVHSGWGGDRVTGGGGGQVDVRLERDVVAYKPTVMTIMLGMNDGRYRAFDSEVFNIYANGYRHIVQAVKAALPELRITVIQPSPYDDVTRPPQFDGGYNAVLIRYGEFVKELAQQEKLTVADLNTSVVAALRKADAANGETAKKIIPDRVHPGPSGHLLMAEALLKAWNAPSVVTDVELDAAGKSITRSLNTEVTFETVEGAFAWAQTDRALPMPVDNRDPSMILAIASSDFVQTLNQQPLKITGLTEQRYALKIDGEDIGGFTKEQLAEGINLAVLPTPMAKQASAVLNLTVRHNTIHYVRWRELQVPLKSNAVAHLREAMDALDAVESDLVAEQRATAQPKTRHFQLFPADKID
jgi:lysophospholipase L1-like esterase